MGREIRRVPPDWKHPKDERGHYIPMVDRTLWQGIWNHIRYDLSWYLKHPKYLLEWFKDMPKAEWHRPPHKTRPAHYQVYETVSEGTPTSPVFATLGEMEAWLIEDQGHRPEAARAFVKDGWAPSMVMHCTSAGATIKMGIDAADF